MSKPQNKAIQGSRPSEAKTEEFHFPGEGKYQPVTIAARNMQEAAEKYEKVKKEINK